MDALREDEAPRGRVLNAVALQNAVLCAECDVVSDSRMTDVWFAGAVPWLTSRICWAVLFLRAAQV